MNFTASIPFQSSQQDFWVQHSMCFIVYSKFNTHTRQSLSNSQTSLLQLSGKHQHSPCSSLEGYHHDYVTGWWHAQKMMVRPITCSTMSNIFLYLQLQVNRDDDKMCRCTKPKLIRCCSNLNFSNVKSLSSLFARVNPLSLIKHFCCMKQLK